MMGFGLLLRKHQMVKKSAEGAGREVIRGMDEVRAKGKGKYVNRHLTNNYISGLKHYARCHILNKVRIN